jgi:hypothetical protein
VSLNQWSSAFAGLTAAEHYHHPDELDMILEAWAKDGAELTVIGASRSGRPIRAASFGSGPLSFVAWGYPHPDEPIGAEVLIALGEAILNRSLKLIDWQFHLILCADPDESRRQRWLAGDGSALAFAQGAWRPTHLGWEVDYGFPLDWGPFWQPDHYDEAAIGDDDPRRVLLPPEPLPESQALRTAIERFRPHLVASLHSTHTGGDYTFLLQREPPAVLDALTAVAGQVGTYRHLGEPIDRGRRWRRADPDLVVERDLNWFARRLSRHRSYQPEYSYFGNHSAAAYIQSVLPQTQFVCPETTQFQHPDFANRQLLDEQTVVRISVEDGKQHRYRFRRILWRDQWVVCDQERVDPSTSLAPITEQVLPISRSMLGVQAVLERRRVLSAADNCWQSISDLADLRQHPYLIERQRMRVPGAYVNDGSMRIFRADPAYRQPATRASAADFRWRWPVHTASLLGNMCNFLFAQEQNRPAIIQALATITELQIEMLTGLPQSLLNDSNRTKALHSVLGRLFILLQAQEQRYQPLSATTDAAPRPNLL